MDPDSRARLAPVVLPPRGRALRPFTMTMSYCFGQIRVSCLGPRSRPHRIDATASLDQARALQLLQRVFQLRNTSTFSRARSSLVSRGFPCETLPRTMRFSRYPTLPLWLRRRFELDAPQRVTHISPTLGHEAQTLKVRKPSPPRATPFKWALGTWEMRKSKEPRENKLSTPYEVARDLATLARRSSSSIALSSPSCHRRCVRDGMEARSRACTRPHCRPRLSFHRTPAKDYGFRKAEVLFTVGTE
jgi:hypothetical protein